MAYIFAWIVFAKNVVVPKFNIYLDVGKIFYALVDGGCNLFFFASKYISPICCTKIKPVKILNEETNFMLILN